MTSIYSFHLAHLPLSRATGALLRPPKAPGLRHIEVLAGMQLGAAVISPRRMQVRRMAVFAEWEDEAALLGFLAQHPFGRKLNDRHVEAMTERDRRDFHHEFTTLRFRPLSEHGSWEGRTDYVPWQQNSAVVPGERV